MGWPPFLPPLCPPLGPPFRPAFPSGSQSLGHQTVFLPTVSLALGLATRLGVAPRVVITSRAVSGSLRSVETLMRSVFRCGGLFSLVLERHKFAASSHPFGPRVQSGLGIAIKSKQPTLMIEQMYAAHNNKIKTMQYTRPLFYVD